jgi:acetyl esterase/lipase
MEPEEGQLIREHKMPSIQSQLLFLFARYGHLLRFQARRKAWSMNTSIPAFREECIRANARLARTMPEGVAVEPVAVCGRRAEWLVPDNARSDSAILYAIGGGFVSGCCDDHRVMVAKLARKSGVRVLLFEHRLAPEHPYPAPLEDMLSAYSWLLDQGYQPGHLVFVGESAGGNLCLAMLLALRDRGIPLPAAVVALSPMTDLTPYGLASRTKKWQDLAAPGMDQVCVKHYIGEKDPSKPWISPLYGDLHGLPPLLIFVGDYETLADEAIHYTEKARAAGVDVTLRVGKGQIHCYPLLAPMFSEATEGMKEMCAFILTHIGQDGSP